jgi:hypothetical protein
MAVGLVRLHLACFLGYEAAGVYLAGWFEMDSERGPLTGFEGAPDSGA